MSGGQSVSACVLTVGTEITSGEIFNSNSKWLSEKLEHLGFSVNLHLSVPDERKLIKDALDFSAQYAEVFIVTGGLGPTSDDFTREVISAWAKAPLEFNDSVWKSLEVLYKERGLTLREAHRQQCHFPKTSELLKNYAGTADGFYLKAHNKHLFVLPGPPREILSMWEPSVVPKLKTLNARASEVLHRWICHGVPESEVAEKVEALIKGKNLRVGYRASKPYVHVKLWLPINPDSDPVRAQEQQQLLSAINQALLEWQVHDGKDREDG